MLRRSRRDRGIRLLREAKRRDQVRRSRDDLARCSCCGTVLVVSPPPLRAIDRSKTPPSRESPALEVWSGTLGTRAARKNAIEDACSKP